MKKIIACFIVLILAPIIILVFNARIVLPKDSDVISLWLYDSLNSKEVLINKEMESTITNALESSRMRPCLIDDNTVPDYILVVDYNKDDLSYCLHINILPNSIYVRSDNNKTIYRITDNDIFDIIKHYVP